MTTPSKPFCERCAQVFNARIAELEAELLGTRQSCGLCVECGGPMEAEHDPCWNGLHFDCGHPYVVDRHRCHDCGEVEVRLRSRCQVCGCVSTPAEWDL